MTKKPKASKRRRIPEPRKLTIPDDSYQPRKAEKEKEYDMPGASLKAIRSAFFRPFALQREGKD